ncbi:MAG: hypothetical protein QGH12_11230, partial [SAR324 cluster bacterium]|nr:hypothetical protein [SAR324 cluster bacterium]
MTLTMDGNKTVNARFERLPFITKQIVGKTVVAGESVSFEVQASGGGSLAYSWFLNDSVIAGASGNKLLIGDVREKDAGAYKVKVGNAVGEIESEAAALAVHFTLNSFAQGSGTVSVSPEAASYAPGTQVTLNAKPSEGYMLGSWSGDASGETNPLTVTMDGNKIIRADFAEIPATVNRVFVNGNLVEEGQLVEVPDEATVELATDFVGGKIFYTLNDERSETYSKPFKLTESASLVVTSYSADFLEHSMSQPVQINILPSWTVSITSTGGGSARLLNQGDSFIQGTEVTAKAEPEAGWEF